jgi:hypothetical protein
MPRGHPGDASNVVQLERRTHVADEREQCRQQRRRIPTRCGLRRCAFFILHKPLPLCFNSQPPFILMRVKD